MATFNLLLPLIVTLILAIRIIPSTTGESHALSQVGVVNETLEWRLQSNSEDSDSEEEYSCGLEGRSLYWKPWWPSRRYYISYGALSANRVPCRPRSGRSYYTHNCYGVSGPVRPYTRGCSAITRCRR